MSSSESVAPALEPADRPNAPWLFRGPTDKRLAFFTDTMRAISRHRDPQQLVLDYYLRMKEAFPTDGFLAVSRRDLPVPCYRITRSDKRGIEFNPWQQRDQVSVFDRGLLGDLLYAGEPRIIDELPGHFADDDPARDALAPHQSLMAVPMFDDGEAINMTLFLRDEPFAFDHETLPDQVWVSNLFGRATTNIVLRERVDQANTALRRELENVGEIQRSLLPERLPEVPGLKVATFYDSSEQAGGDYYDFFELSDGRLGVLVADVSGHGTPAAVLMAVVHAIAHSIENPPDAEPPGRLLAHLNRHLCERYTKRGGTFVTAWAAVIDPATRRVTFANAGHPSPRLKHANGRGDAKAGAVEPLSGNARSLPLGIDPSERYPDTEATLEPGDVLVVYTDGITESRSPTREMWNVAGLDDALSRCSCDPRALLDNLLAQLNDFTRHSAPGDDRTVVTMKLA